VFDFLSIELGLPNFTVDNWTSELRNGIPDLPPFVGISYADFRYHDLTGELTRQLLPHQPEIHGATPEIFIEVKATTGTQDEIFHMSPLQLRYVSCSLIGLLYLVLTSPTLPGGCDVAGSESEHIADAALCAVPLEQHRTHRRAFA